MLLLSLFLAVQAPADSVQIVTRDIPNFWRAYDLGAGEDSLSVDTNVAIKQGIRRGLAGLG